MSENTHPPAPNLAATPWQAPQQWRCFAAPWRTLLSALLFATNAAGADDMDYNRARTRMVAEQLSASTRGISNPAVLQAMATVPRHEFVPANLRRYAYDDRPLPIGYAQTISQP